MAAKTSHTIAPSEIYLNSIPMRVDGRKGEEYDELL
jgi:hypothetical protein